MNPLSLSSVPTFEKVIYTMVLGVRTEGRIFSLQITALRNNSTQNEGKKISTFTVKEKVTINGSIYLYFDMRAFSELKNYSKILEQFKNTTNIFTFVQKLILMSFTSSNYYFHLN